MKTAPLPDFSALNPKTIESELDNLLTQHRAELTKMLQSNDEPQFDNFVAPLESMDVHLENFWSPVSHLNNVLNTKEWRETYNRCLPKIVEYYTERSHNENLYHAYEAVSIDPSFEKLSKAQKTLVKHALRDFRLAGVHLNKEDKKQCATYQNKLSELSTKYSENLLDATNAWTLSISDKKSLSGLPDIALASAAQAAKQRNKKGWLITLESPSFLAIMKYADDRDLRKKVYEAYVTRASEEGPHAGKWDNGPIMIDILDLRFKLSNLLGFSDYADYSLATKMAVSKSEVLELLHDLAKQSRPFAEKDMEQVAAFAKKDGINKLETWDLSYYSERLRESAFEISEEILRPYFPLSQVQKGLFDLVHTLYGITIKEKKNVSVWHPDVKFFEVKDASGMTCAQFYMDLFARENKRDGAWMDECRSRHQFSDYLQTPVAYLVTNFNAPVDDQPALLTHYDVETLFHEFGHCLHHMLTRVDFAPVAGTSGVPWDAVELPSQFMENFCWEREIIHKISKHFKTNKTLPDDLFDRMINAKHFQSGYQMMRQIEFSLFDFLLHSKRPPENPKGIQSLLDDIRKETSVIAPPAFNRFQNSFSHIFDGGYAAGYYSYKWAEVLSADAYSRFEEEGIFNEAVGHDFLHHILEMGGSEEPMDLFVKFRGRKPSIEALLRHSGFVVQE